MGNEIFEEIKRKYKKSNKYMLYVSYEDIGILIQIIETMNKRKLEDMTFEYFNDYELKKKLYKHIEMLEKENCHENCGLEKLIDCGRQCSIGCTIKNIKKILEE